MAIKESGEMYLENIYVLKKQLTHVRLTDIAHYASYSKPSVSRALGILKKDGYLTIDKEGSIELTKQGEKIASQIYERHVFLTDFLTTIGVKKEIASSDACKIEHHLSEETFTKLKEFVSQWKQKD